MVKHAAPATEDGFLSQGATQILISRLIPLSWHNNVLRTTVSMSNNAMTSTALKKNYMLTSTTNGYNYSALSFTSAMVAVQYQFPHYVLIYVLIFVLVCICIAIIKCLSKEKAKMLRLILNMNLFNLKPIYKHTPDSDVSDYLMPQTSNVLMGCSKENENSDAYEMVIFDRLSLNSRTPVSTNL